MSKLGRIKENQKILDPCVGPGIFIKSLLKSGVKKSQIFAYDLNPSFKKDVEKLGVSFRVSDTILSFNPDSFEKFDFIIGNPPYLNKASHYIKANRSELKKIYGEINAHETYSMFIVNSIWRLKEGGKLGFITSDSFLTLSTHKKLRKFILENCVINEILLAPKYLFSNQDVSTSPVIIILTKHSGEAYKQIRENNIMRIVPRVKSELDYQYPKIIHDIPQKKYNSLPFNIFFVDVEDQVITLFEKAPKLEDFIKGYIGMHTHNNRKYLAAIEGTKLAEIFNKRNKKIPNQENRYKIITKCDLESKNWKPYLKRGGGEQYWRPLMEAVDWDKESVRIYDIPKNVPFEKEGIAISGVSSRFAARFMPKGCYWDSNKVIGFVTKDESISIFYALGLLNSSLYNYLAKGIINNTSSIQITGIHALPFVKADNGTMNEVERLVKRIIEKKKEDIKYDYNSEQKIIDDVVFNFYSNRFNLSKTLKRKLDKRYSNYKS